APELRKIIDADDSIVVARPHVVHPRFELDEIVNVRAILAGPLHLANDSAERIRAFRGAAGHAFERLEHPILIEPAVPEIGFGVDAQLELAAPLRLRG